MADFLPHIVHYQADDGVQLGARVWSPPQPIGQVVLLHGIISHGGWYEPTCSALAERGWEVHMLDRRGSGLNPVSRGDVDQWCTWIRDVEGYLANLPASHPRVLVGISWGGKLAVSVARMHPQLVNGLVLISPGLYALRGANSWQQVALKLAARTTLHKRRVTIPLEDPALFTASPEWQQYIQVDPLTLRKITVRFAREDLRLTQKAIEMPWQVHCPLLLALAGKDSIIDVHRVRQFIQDVAGSQLTVLDYPEATHTFEFDPVQETYNHELGMWFDQRVES